MHNCDRNFDEAYHDKDSSEIVTDPSQSLVKNKSLLEVLTGTFQLEQYVLNFNEPSVKIS